MPRRRQRRRVAAAALSTRCPRCGARHRSAQRYCLECGLALPVRAGALPAARAAWVRRLGWYPGDFVWGALLALVLAAGGAAAALAAGQWRDGSHPATVVAPLPTSLPAGAPGPEPSGRARWPATVDGWTVVLDSQPVADGKPAASALAARAAAAGLPQVGVILSARFASLTPGYFIVFSGVYGSELDAEDALRSIQARGYAGAYPVEIVP